jgi:hypothetical protein
MNTLDGDTKFPRPSSDIMVVPLGIERNLSRRLIRYSKLQATISWVSLRTYADTMEHRAEFIEVASEILEIANDCFLDPAETAC